MEKNDIITKYWTEFLRKTDREENLEYFECFHFEMTEKLANELLELVLIGKKQATASSALSYQVNNEPIPKVGDLSIVTDWDGNPRCIIETTEVAILKFKDIDYEICKREGEDDNLESWQAGHIKYFTQDGKASGYEFTWDMPVVFEDFKVIYK